MRFKRNLKAIAVKEMEIIGIKVAFIHEKCVTLQVELTTNRKSVTT